MNVWIWGPPLWDTLHSCASVLDANKIDCDNLMRPLTKILPCRFCRQSFEMYYDELGSPRIGRAFEWTFDVHNKVNKKLAMQKIEKFCNAKNWSQSLKNELINNSEHLFGQPTIDVVKKRVIVNSDEKVSWAKVSTSLLAITMGLQANGDTSLLGEFRTFVEAIIQAAEVSNQANGPLIVTTLRGLLKISEHGPDKMRTYIELVKYNSKNASAITNLIVAGACVAETCK